MATTTSAANTAAVDLWYTQAYHSLIDASQPHCPHCGREFRHALNIYMQWRRIGGKMGMNPGTPAGWAALAQLLVNLLAMYEAACLPSVQYPTSYEDQGTQFAGTGPEIKTIVMRQWFGLGPQDWNSAFV